MSCILLKERQHVNGRQSVRYVIFILTFSWQSLFAQTISGDFRFRHDAVMRENTPDQHRQRQRVRVGLNAPINDITEFNFRMSTAERMDNDSPSATSGNTTYDNAGTKKEVFIDLAYVKHVYSPTLSLSLGKQENNFYSPGRSDLIFDGDWTPEGLGFFFSPGGEKNIFYVRGSAYWLEERPTQSDAGLLGIQAGRQMQIGLMTFIFGIGRHQFNAVKNYPFLVNANSSFGNSTNGTNYEFEYEVNEAFLELQWMSFSLPIALYVHGITNAMVEEDGDGFLVGINIGKIKAERDIMFSYRYRAVEKDATIGAISESDFGGGGTDNRGHQFALIYFFHSDTQLNLTHSIAERSVSTTPTDYERTQADLIFKF